MIRSNMIGYEESALSGKWIYAFNPALQERMEPGFAVATEREVDVTLRKAHTAWRLYRALPGRHRALFLRAIADGIEGLGDLLIHTIKDETAYPESRIMVERGRTCMQLRMFADLAEHNGWQTITVDQALPDRKPLPRPELIKKLFTLGPVVVFGAGNFPLAYSTAGGDVASALCVGCPVVIKAHESHLHTNALVAEVIRHAAIATGMPDGVFSSLQGDGYETGKQLVRHPLTAAVGFTGSLAGGRALFDLANQRDIPIPVFAEMGSVNPIFLFPGAIKAGGVSLISKLVSSMTMSVGQFCTNPGILFAIKSATTDHFIHAIKTELEKIEPMPMLNPGIAANFRKGVERIASGPVSKVVTIHADEGHTVAPVLAVCDERDFVANPHLHHEIFGPYSLVVLCDDTDRFPRMAEVISGQLTVSVFAEKEEFDHLEALMPFLAEKAGRVIFNGVPTGVEVCAAMTHGGPYPASTDSRFTAVGHHAVQRWLRPLTFQNFPEARV